LLWYEIDAILREDSDSKITLDDFVRRFLGRYDAAKDMMGFEESDVISILNDLHPYDWQSLIDDRVRGLHDEIPLQVLDRMGYRIEYTSRPTHTTTIPHSPRWDARR
jgi:predicted metalloprotease with PDZ domain